MPADFDPSDRTAPNEALRAVYQRGKALRDPAGWATGNQQSDEGFQRVDGGRSLEGNQAPPSPTHPDDEWTIDALHGHMEHLFGEEDEFSKASADAIGWCLERIEALTAENARLTAERDRLRDTLNQTVQEACAAIDDDLKPEIARLTGEVERLTAERDVIKDRWEGHLRVYRLTQGIRDREAAMQEIADLGQAMQPELYAGATEAPSDEAEGLRPLTPDDIASHSYLLTRAAKLDDGINMPLLGSLCREEPDEATKREVAEMMAKVRAAEYSPLSHPDYPALVKMARESAKDGD